METNSLNERVKRRFDHNRAKTLLKEKYSAKMIFAHNGGMWCAGPELITQCNLCVANNQFEPVLVDTHENPVKIDAEELKNLALQRWQEQMNAWHQEYEELCKQR